jgi:hypothetical protein
MPTYDKQKILDNIDVFNFYQQRGLSLEPNGNGRSKPFCCIFHKESKPSASVKLDAAGKGQRGSYKCFGCEASHSVFDVEIELTGCDFKEALGRLAKLAGVEPESQQQTNRSRQPFMFNRQLPISRHEYTDETGTILYYNLKFPGKRFCAADAAGIIRKGIFDEFPEVPYNLPGIKNAKTIIYVEGEKDADRLIKEGFAATTRHGSKATSQWPPGFAQDHFANASVVVIPDNDQPGRKKAQKAAAAISTTRSPIDVTLKALEPFGDVDGYDISNWFDDGGTAEALQKIFDEAPPYKPDPNEEPGKQPDPIVAFPPATPEQTQVKITKEPADPEALITYNKKPLLILGIVGAIVSAGGVGKTYFMLLMAYMLAGGSRIGPLRAAKVEGFNVLFISAEDSQEELNRRLWRISGGSGEFPDKLHVYSVNGLLGPLMRLVGGNPERGFAFAWLDKTLDNHKGLRLLILDTKSRFYGLDENNNDHGAQWIACLEFLAQKHNITILFAHHVSKNAVSKGGIDTSNSRGASAITDNCRWVAGMIEMQDKTGKRYGISDTRNYVEFDISKTNYTAKLPSSFIFKRTENGVLEYAALESERREKRSKFICETLKESSESFSKRDLERGEGSAGKIFETIRLEFPELKKKTFLELIDELIQKRSLELVKVESDGKGAPKNVIKVR